MNKKSTVGLSIASLAAAASLLGASPAHADLVVCVTDCSTRGDPFHKGGDAFIKVENNFDRIAADVFFKFGEGAFSKVESVFIKIESAFSKIPPVIG